MIEDESDTQNTCRACRLGVHSETMARTLQVRDVPDDVHTTLRARAAAAGMSLSEYVLQQLVEVASRPEVSDVLRRAGERSGGAAPGDIVAAVRSVRDTNPSA